MTEYLEDFKKALTVWTRVNPIVQAPIPSRFVMFVFSVIFTILIGGFEYLRLNE